jgi:HAD superfamily hydrolase (TIGR01490 family)
MMNRGYRGLMPGFAFFDLDHTLLPFDTQTLFANFVVRRERWRTAYLLAFAPVAALRGCGLASTVTAKRAFLNYLWGMKRERVQSLAREFAETEVKRWVYPELLPIIAEHRAAGRTLLLNTASPDIYPHEIARALGFDQAIATKVERHPVMPLMPCIPGVNNKREEKIAAMKREVPAVAEATPEQLQDSWAYSDSKADLPLLELAGHPVLIHPNPELEALGKARGWQIMRPARPYHSKMGSLWFSARQAVGAFNK